jgi:hypothetical protein
MRVRVFSLAQQIFSTMHSVGPGSAIFFVVLNILGTYILLNLFTAILLSNFESMESAHPGSMDPNLRRLSARLRVRGCHLLLESCKPCARYCKL